MIEALKTKAEAAKTRYGVWAGNPKGTAYKPERCAGRVFKWHISHQCQKTDGHGPGALYCKQHAKKIAEREAR